MPPAGQHFLTHESVKAFRDGFNLQLDHNTHLLDLFGPYSKVILQSLNSRYPRKGSELNNTKYFEFTPSSPSGLSSIEQDFIDGLFKYLHGSGHVDHPALMPLIPPEEVAMHATDEGFRARRILRYITGQEIFPKESVKVQTIVAIA